MKVGYCQFDVLYKNIEGNLKTILRLLSGKDADVIVLPELCISGYYYSDKKELFEFSNATNYQKIVEELKKIAQMNNMFLIAGITEVESNNLYNTAVVIGPEGLVHKHRKVNITKNENIFNRGTSFEIIEIKNVKIGIAICFDCWFPESFRLLSLKGAQIVCCPTNFGGPWTLEVTKVRSLENTVFTIMANRIGEEQMGGEKAHFRGESQIIDCNGNALEKAGNDECVNIIEIDPEVAKIKKNIICEDMLFEMKQYEKNVKYLLNT